METTLLFEPTDPTIKTLDLQISDLLNNLDHSLYDGPEYKIAISDSKKLFKPYRTITIGGSNGYIFINAELEKLGFENLLKENPFKGFDGIYALK